MRSFRTCLPFGRIAILAAALLATTFMAPGQARAEEVTALVPAYFYPSWLGSPWDQLTASASQIPIEAIMNPASGPGTAPNSDYQGAVGRLQAAGGKVIGYVDTAYGSRAESDILADITSYVSWYGVDGVFLDQVGNYWGGLDYAELYTEIKALGANFHVVGNAGSPWSEAYVSVVDVLVIFEGPLTNTDPWGPSFTNYPDHGPYAGLYQWWRNYPASKFANIVYGVPGAQKMNSVLHKAIINNASYVYITDDGLPNPYDRLPSYWQQEVNKIAGINGDF